MWGKHGKKMGKTWEKHGKDEFVGERKGVAVQMPFRLLDGVVSLRCARR